MMLTPKEIVAELNRYIIGQERSKKLVAIALRNRWRRQQLDVDMRNEIIPKNILMIGPTGVGKTEIARRLAKLANSPFVKVEATKFTEVGYVGRDVDQIIRDLAENAIHLVKDRKRSEVEAEAKAFAENKILDILVGRDASDATKESFRARLQDGSMDDKEIDVDVPDSGSGGMFSNFDMGAGQLQMGMIDMNDMLGKAFGGEKTKSRRLKIAQAKKILTQVEADKLIDNDVLTEEALNDVEQNGIVFLDEIDKICAKGAREGTVSREGVQRDLLPLIEGTTVATKYGSVKTDHILFIAAGAFHIAKPSDLLPELQGRLPVRVELESLTEKDFECILKDTENSLIKQYEALISTENVKLSFSSEAIQAIARIAFVMNEQVENIGARRLMTVLEKLLEDISYSASEKRGETFNIDHTFVNSMVGNLSQNMDLSKFIL